MATTTRSKSDERTDGSDSMANDGGTSRIGETARQVAGAAGTMAGTVAGVAGDVGARLPDAANEANRLVHSGSDETLKLAGALSIGFAMGLLVGGAPRILVLAALVPAGLIGSTLLERMDGTDRLVQGA
jgi:hypothetical protein